MAALPNTRLTLADLLKYMDPQGGVAPVVELLAQRNESMADPLFMPGNLPTGHQFSVRTALPTAYLRDYNEGVMPSKAAAAQQTEGMCIVEAWSEVDAAEAKLNGNEAAFRAQEDKAFIQSMEQQFVQQMFYGNVRTDPKAVNGLITRIGTASHPQFIDCSGTGVDNTSILVAQWGDDLHGIYPKGSEAGLQAMNHGKQIIQFSDGKRMLALVSQFVWNFGFVQRDYRTTVRIGNIDVSELRARTGTQALTAATNILYALHDAQYRLPTPAGAVAYMNRAAHSSLSKMAMDKSSNVLSVREGLNQFGKPYRWLDFNGMQLRCVDRLLNNEAHVFN